MRGYSPRLKTLHRVARAAATLGVHEWRIVRARRGGGPWVWYRDPFDKPQFETLARFESRAKVVS